jgi:hypothetical protein
MNRDLALLALASYKSPKTPGADSPSAPEPEAIDDEV